MSFFDYESVAREACIPEQDLSKWRDWLAQEYHGDVMMVELRLLRACQAVLKGAATLDTIRESIEAEFRAGQPAGS